MIFVIYCLHFKVACPCPGRGIPQVQQETTQQNLPKGQSFKEERKYEEEEKQKYEEEEKQKYERKKLGKWKRRLREQRRRFSGQFWRGLWAVDNPVG